MSVKKRKLVDLSKDDKNRITRTAVVTIATVAIICSVLVGCFACKQDAGTDLSAHMTDEQKAEYWGAMVIGVDWAPMTDATHDGVLKGLFLPRDARTEYDSNTSSLFLSFLYDPSSVMISANLVLSSEEGELRFESSDVWKVKFSEKNEILYMTITDSDGKTVYYQQK